jgi:hypothetical protein
MRLEKKVVGWFGGAILALPLVAGATSCTPQAELLAPDRDALAAAASRIAEAVASQDYATLKAVLLPAVAADWEGIRGTVEGTASLVRGGKLQLENAYLLDASSLTAAANTQFFCSTPTGSQTVTLTMQALPPGRYAVVLAEAAGSQYGGQMGIILAWDGTDAKPGWKLGGISIRPGIIDEHDGVFYWSKARSLAGNSEKADAWSAWFNYDLARALLLPLDFLSSPNLEKLNQEQGTIRNSPQDAFPYTLTDGPRSWKIDAVRLDPSLLHADLGVVYESNGVTDLAAQKTEALAVLSALLKAQPGLRDNFHGLSAVSVKDGKQTPVMEVAMGQVP